MLVTIGGKQTLFLDRLGKEDFLQAAAENILVSSRVRPAIVRYKVCPSIVWTPVEVVAGTAKADFFRVEGQQINIVDPEATYSDFQVRWIRRVLDPQVFLENLRKLRAERQVNQ